MSPAEGPGEGEAMSGGRQLEWRQMAPWGPGPPAGRGGGAARTAMGHCRRRGAWGRTRGGGLGGWHGLVEGAAGNTMLSEISDRFSKRKQK